MNQTIAARNATAMATREKNIAWPHTRAHHAATLESRFDGNRSAMMSNPIAIRKGTTRTRPNVQRAPADMRGGSAAFHASHERS